MAARIWIGTRARAAYLQRLSVVFAVELRLRIMTELYLREMSPKQFFEQFGGGSISRVANNFATLTGHGWLRYIRSERGGGRRGAVEHFYRATEPAIFDFENWSQLPYSIRVGFSWTTLKQFADQFRTAMKAGVVDSRAERSRHCESLILDEVGWATVIAAVDRMFVGLYDEQTDARLRMFRSRDRPMLATVVLAVFESPLLGSVRVGPRLVESRDSAVPFARRISKVLADETSLQIVADTNSQPVSAAMFQAEHGGDGDSIRRRFRMLERIGWLKKVDEQTGGRRRGAREKFYSATGPALVGSIPWLESPISIPGDENWAFFERLSGQVIESMKAGTFDSRADRYLAWSLLRLDELGWRKVAAAVTELRALILREGRKAEARLQATGERPIRTNIGLAAFESAELPREP